MHCKTATTRTLLFLATCGAPSIAAAQYGLPLSDSEFYPTANRRFMLEYPDAPERSSTAEVSAMKLVITDASGTQHSYTRAEYLDSNDGDYVAYVSRRLRQAIRWPVSDMGHMLVKRGSVPWKESVMLLVPYELPDHPEEGDVGSLPWEQPVPVNGTWPQDSSPLATPPPSSPEQPVPGLPGGPNLPPTVPGDPSLPRSPYTPPAGPPYGQPVLPEWPGEAPLNPLPPEPPKPQYLGSERVPGKPMDPVTVCWKNSGPEELVLRITDRRNKLTDPIEVSIPPGESTKQTIVPYAPDILEKSYLVPDGTGWRKEVLAQTLESTSQFTVVAFQNRTTYRYINSLNPGKPGTLASFNRQSLSGLGSFRLPVGEGLYDGVVLDAYRIAVKQRNPGSVTPY